MRQAIKWVLEHSRTLLVWACFVFVLASLVLIGTFSPSYQKCTTDHERHYGQNKQTNLHQTVVSGPHIPLFFVCQGVAIDENNGTLTAIATIAIAGFTLTLWRATTKQAELTRTVADAAKKSAEALPVVERCYVFFEYKTHLINTRELALAPDELAVVRRLDVSYALVNYGRTPAVLGETRIGMRRTNGELPVDAWASAPPINLPNIILSSSGGVTSNLSMGDTEPMAESVANQIEAGSLFVYFFGHIIYEDIFGCQHETQFCWRLNRDAFAEWGGREHNYRT